MTVSSDIIERHIVWTRVMHRRSEGTLTQRRHHLERLDRWLCARRETTLLAASGEDLLAWRELMDTAHLAASSQSSRIAHARSFYTWAAEEDLSPAKLLRYLVAPSVQQPLPRPIAQDELDLAIGRAVGRAARYRPWLLLAAYAGLRAMEVSHLKAEDFYFNGPRAAIRVLGKGNKERIVPAGDTLVEALRELDLPRRGYLFPALDRMALVVPGSHVSAGQVSHLGSRFLHETGSPSSFHALRHRFGTDLYAMTDDLVLVAAVMGHANINTTKIYTLHNQKRAAAAINEITFRRLGGTPPEATPNAA